MQNPQWKFKSKKERKQEKRESNMCKVLMIPGIKPEHAANAWKFVQKAQGPMCRSDRDGYGYVGLTADGHLFGERWVDPSDAFTNRFLPCDREKFYLNEYMGALKRTVEYNNFGEVHRFNDAVSIMAHARMATCGKGLHNTHPFIIDNTALIHNGVIRNTTELDYKNSTCDSECILTQYLTEKVKDDVCNIQNVATALNGYYDVGIMGTAPWKNRDGSVVQKPYMDIFKDNTANLVAAYIEELETLVFATNLEIINSAARDCFFKVGFVLQVEPGVIMRIDAVTGETLEVADFDYNYVSPALRSVSNERDDLTSEDVKALEKLENQQKDPYFAMGEGYRTKKA